MNNYVPWLPSNSQPLTHDQLGQAFFDAMPTTWKYCFQQAGNSNTTMPYTQMACYFLQENLANCHQQENQQLQQRQSKARRRNHKGSPCTTPLVSPNHKCPRNQDGKTKGDSANKGKCIEDNAPYPVHPGMNHTWGQCFSNTYNKDRPQKDTKRQKTNNMDNNAIKIKEKPRNLRPQPPLMILQSTMMKSSCRVSLTATVMSNVTQHPLTTRTLCPTLHRLKRPCHLLRPTTMCNPLVPFATSYVNGDSDVYVLNSINDDFARPLWLCSIGFMTVKDIQGHISNAPCAFCLIVDPTKQCSIKEPFQKVHTPRPYPVLV